MRAAVLLAGVMAAGVGLGRAADPPAGGGFPTFKAQEIDTALSIGYAVLVADIDGDKKPDVVVVDQKKVMWYQNPSWKKRVILDGKTKPDNVCAAALDVDGGGDLELVLGAGWKPFDTATPGTLQWLKRGKSLDDEWTVHPIPCDEPTVHRVRAADLDGDGKPEIVMVPLMGRDATAKGNWLDGRPVRILSYPLPADPTKPAAWKPRVLSDELHVVHNFDPWPGPPGKPGGLLAASYEGITLVPAGPDRRPGLRWHQGDQDNPGGSRGASEVRRGTVGTRTMAVATIEPWHGNQVVTYTYNPPEKRPATPPPPGTFPAWDRHVIDAKLRWGHAVQFADLDGDGTDELIVGVRDDPNPKAGDTFNDRRGVRVYRCTDGKGARWDRLLVDPGGVAVEDLAVADLNGDGRPDVVAVGRQTRNCRIYWNRGR